MRFMESEYKRKKAVAMTAAVLFAPGSHTAPFRVLCGGS
jgi:hypothetical protein